MYLATVLLEPNRWKPGELPVFHWEEKTGERIAEAGFSGIELWQGHWVHATARQREWMVHSACPVRIFNWYGIPEAGEFALPLEAAGAFPRTLRGIKFNFGKPGTPLDSQCAGVVDLIARLAPEVSLLCECHAGTLLEHPEEAARVLLSLPERVRAIVHPFTCTNLSAWLEKLGSRVAHLHLQYRTAEEWADPLPEIPEIQEACQLLRSFKFSGTASLEFLRAISSSGSPAELLEAAAAVQARWEPGLCPWVS